MRRRVRHGRPRKTLAKRRTATTLAARRPAVDHGSPELIRRKLLVANGSPVAVELVDIVGVLFANHLIEAEEETALRLVSGWLTQLRKALQLRQASPAGLWQAIVSATGIGTAATYEPPGGDRALFRLGELFEHFTAIGRLSMLQLLVRVAAGEGYPESAAEVAAVREGARIVLAVLRRGRRTAVVSAQPRL